VGRDREGFPFTLAGLAGQTLSVKRRMQSPFKVDKIQATDNSPNPGYGTRIMGCYVGNMLQRPAPPDEGTLTAFFAPDALGNHVSWDKAGLGIEIQIDVKFDVDCTWDCDLIGWVDVVDETEIY
jgi:hypothetical protein